MLLHLALLLLLAHCSLLGNDQQLRILLRRWLVRCIWLYVRTQRRYANEMFTCAKHLTSSLDVGCHKTSGSNN